jgi:hypothetical protein
MDPAVTEKIVGPFGGYYLAVYAAPAPAPEQGFVGYCKVCSAPPTSYWEASCCAKVTGLAADSQERAMRLAEARALALVFAWVDSVSLSTTTAGH